MEQKKHSNCRETVTFGKANVFIEPPTSNGRADDTLFSGVKSSSTGIS
jgi:hypothetical protein